MFSVSTGAGGNGNLTKPIGLMTADEVMFAGSIFKSQSYSIENESAYYYRNSLGYSATDDATWWTMTPCNFYNDNYGAYMVSVSGALESAYTGDLEENAVVTSASVRPVISLKSCVKLSGRGSTSDPYTVSADASCEEAEN